jgi:ribosomal protein RSM22 (predicted rRNA methylase)
LAERQPSKLHVASSNLVSRSTSPASGVDALPDRTASERRAAIAESALRLRRVIARTIRAGPSLTANAAALSAGYRSGAAPADPGGHVHDSASAEAYAAARMPATHAACARAMAAAADRLPGFRPTGLLDVGAGTGAASWAATAVWPSLAELALIDREPAAVALGRRLAAAAPGSLAGAAWSVADINRELPERADLVVAAYVLGELAAAEAAAAVEVLWASTDEVLILVEPGRRAGFERIRTARAALIAAGGHVAAPCPGDEACPIVDPAWCHFLARLDRSPLQRRAKAADRSWEDEPFSYVAVSRVVATPAPRVVLGRPRQRPGVVELRVCLDGRIEQRTLSRRDGPAWKAARDLQWGDPVPADVLDARRRAAPPSSDGGR